MAQSPSHKFGQIIGDLLEEMIHQPLKRVADKHGLFLDYKHPRPARNNRRKVAWTDHKGNVHDLDYVLELNGSEDEIGSPKAFIESAWRRYTKHSRNKAQEIQGAIGPLAATYSEYHPFLGVVLAGVFTEGSLAQLRSHGFSILYYPYEVICRALDTVGINAAFDEETPDAEVQMKVNAYAKLTDKQKRKIVSTLRRLRQANVQEFLDQLEASLERRLAKICIVSLHGSSTSVTSVADAIRFVEDYDEQRATDGFWRYEINVEYSNGDTVNSSFHDKLTAIRYLNQIH